MRSPALKRFIPAALMAMSTWVGEIQAAIVIGGPIINPANGHRYYLLSPDDWPTSQAVATAIGGSLATIDNAAEQVWVFNTFSEFGGVVRNLWIGLTDQAVEGAFVWADGSNSTYRNWGVGSPDSFGEEDFAFMLHPRHASAGKWIDLFGGYNTWQEHPICGVVELPPASTIPTLPSSDDLWDVKRDIVVVKHSALDNCGRNPATPYDMRDLFGGTFVDCPGEPFHVLFADGAPTGFMHFVEWRTAAPVTIRSFNLWAAGDGSNSAREIGNFRLLAKTGGSSEFNSVLKDFAPSHPYAYVNGVFGLLVSTDIKPVTAQEFRAEFTQPAGSSFAPRLIELDGFSEFIGPSVGVRVSEVEIAWESVEGLRYQIEFRTDASGSNWNSFGPVRIGDGRTIRVADAVSPEQERRFYRVRIIE